MSGNDENKVRILEKRVAELEERLKKLEEQLAVITRIGRAAERRHPWVYTTPPLGGEPQGWVCREERR